LLVEQIEVDGVAKLRTGCKLLDADGLVRIVRIGDALLERLPVQGQAAITDTLEMLDGLGRIGDGQATLHEKRELVGETKVRLGVGRQHGPDMKKAAP
jgi:hypothetical protein